MVKGILNRVKNCLKAEANQSGMPESQTCSTIGPLASLLGPAGRITLASLKKVYQECEREDFIEFVRNPVLAGSAFFDVGCPIECWIWNTNSDRCSILDYGMGPPLKKDAKMTNTERGDQ